MFQLSITSLFRRRLPHRWSLSSLYLFIESVSVSQITLSYSWIMRNYAWQILFVPNTSSIKWQTLRFDVIWKICHLCWNSDIGRKCAFDSVFDLNNIAIWFRTNYHKTKSSQLNLLAAGATQNIPSIHKFLLFARQIGCAVNLSSKQLTYMSK